MGCVGDGGQRKDKMSLEHQFELRASTGERGKCNRYVL